jgi:hypothetical protein
MVMAQSKDAFVVRLEWRPRGANEDREQFQVLRVRGDMVHEMRDYRTGREAMKAAR